MAREILFRGKRTDNGEWVEGVPYFLNIVEDEPEDCVNKACIITGVDWDGSWGFLSPDNRCFVEVDPATVGQLHNGLSKKAGISIFEGDIIRHDLEAGLGQPKRIGLTETVRSVEFDFHYYSNVRLIGNIHEEREVKNG